MKKVIVGKWGVWDTLEQCAAANGLSASTVSRKMRDFTGEFRYLDRVFAVRLKAGGYELAVMDSVGRMFIPLGYDGLKAKIRQGEVSEVRDVTLNFYCGTEFEGFAGYVGK